MRARDRCYHYHGIGGSGTRLQPARKSALFWYHAFSTTHSPERVESLRRENYVCDIEEARQIIRPLPPALATKRANQGTSPIVLLITISG